jgi:hypothetical protein
MITDKDKWILSYTRHGSFRETEEGAGFIKTYMRMLELSRKPEYSKLQMTKGKS